MLVLRCTRRLFLASRIDPVAEPPSPTSSLGEWYANQVSLPFRGRSLVGFVHSGSLLTVLAPGRVLRTTVPVFQKRLPSLLRRLDLPEPWIETQMSALTSVCFARTASRSVLGSMSDIAEHIRAEAEWARSYNRLDLSRLEDRLAGVIFGALSYRCPIDELGDLAAAKVRPTAAGSKDRVGADEAEGGVLPTPDDPHLGEAMRAHEEVRLECRNTLL